jgi:hypothetical protein
MSCRIRGRQCISATVDHNYEPRGVKTYAIFGSDRPFQRTFCDPRLSAHAVRDRRDPLPAFANLLGLYGRGDRAAWDLGGGLARPCPASALPPLGHRRVRSGAKNLAERCAVVATLDLCRARRHGTGRGIGLSHRLPVQEGQRHGAGIRDIEGLDRARHIEAHQEIAIFPAEAPHPLAFAAEHERNRAPQRRLRQI